jgi:phosphatidylglycerophosphate synthase
MTTGEPSPRRPVAARGSGWAVTIAAKLVRRGVRPNAISLTSVAAAALAAACLLLAGGSPLAERVTLLVLAAGLIQLRLLCNLLDGMVAIEGGLGTKQGPVFNELPDRLSDAIILVSAGYFAGAPAWTAALAWCAALFAVLTAYVRALAESLGATQDFGGPMAKQARMNVISAACLLGAALAPVGHTGLAITAGLLIVGVGSVITVIRRTSHLLRELGSR